MEFPIFFKQNNKFILYFSKVSKATTVVQTPPNQMWTLPTSKCKGNKNHILGNYVKNAITFKDKNGTTINISGKICKRCNDIIKC